MTRCLTEKKLVLATHNRGKVAEISDLLRFYDIEILSAADLGLAEPDETETSFAGNATLKARAAALGSGLPALADDSGLCVHALNGAPGVYSADWAGKDKDFIQAMGLIHSKLGHDDDRSAYFISVLALVWPDGETVTTEGRVNGELVWPPRGDNGFGYDAMFVPQGETRTFAEMTMAEKKQYSHRAMAFQSLIKQCLTD